jgi:MFS family permease
VYNLFSLLLGESFPRWGWRVPFLLGIVLLGVGLFIRLKLLESPLFAQLRDKAKPVRVPFFEVIRRYPRNVLLAMGSRFAENGCFYIFTVFALAYASDHLKLEKTMMLNGVLLASAVQFILIPAFGILSDRIGRRPVYIGGAVALAMFAFPFFWMVDTCTVPVIWLALVVALIVHAMMYAPQAAFLSELFGTEVRYTGASIGYQLASPLAGGLAPLIATALLEWSTDNPWPVAIHLGGQVWPVAVYLMALAAVTIVSVWLATETHRRELGDTGHDRRQE